MTPKADKPEPIDINGDSWRVDVSPSGEMFTVTYETEDMYGAVTARHHMPKEDAEALAKWLDEFLRWAPQ